MKYRPILFNTDMTQAIQGGRKTQTRRLIQGFCDDDHPISGHPHPDLPGSNVWEFYCEDEKSVNVFAPCVVGDVLWVRETWTSEAGRYYYRADFESDFLDPCETLSGGYPASCIGKDCDFCQARPERICWRPSIHMPKEAARIFLSVCHVRPQKLMEISKDEALLEGANAGMPIKNFIGTWNRTIKKDELNRSGWYANPWVWVIEFEKIEKPENWP